MARVFVERPAWEARDPTAECTPALDVIETADGLEILMDLPGIAASAVDVAVERGTLVIAGHKQPPSCQHDNAGFHLAERAFGRFARGVAIDGPYDTGKARATLSHGELRIVLPRIDDRRGRRITIPVRG
jgi:HSP20 family protein